MTASVIPASFSDGSSMTVDSYAGQGYRAQLEAELEDLRARCAEYLRQAQNEGSCVVLTDLVAFAKAQDRIIELERSLHFDPDVPLYLTLLLTSPSGAERRVRFEPVPR